MTDVDIAGLCKQADDAAVFQDVGIKSWKFHDIHGYEWNPAKENPLIEDFQRVNRIVRVERSKKIFLEETRVFGVANAQVDDAGTGGITDEAATRRKNDIHVSGITQMSGSKR